MPMRFRAGNVVATVIFSGFVATGAVGGISLMISPPAHAPPPLRAEPHGNAPFKDAVWIDGRWDWRDARFVWLGGHWERARQGYHSWKQGQWVARGNSWVWIPGEWLTTRHKSLRETFRRQFREAASRSEARAQ